MREEMKRIEDLPPPGFTANAATNGRPPLYFPSSNMEQVKNPPSTPAQNPSVIDLTTQNPENVHHQASPMSHPGSRPYMRPALLTLRVRR